MASAGPQRQLRAELCAARKREGTPVPLLTPSSARAGGVRSLLCDLPRVDSCDPVVRMQSSFLVRILMLQPRPPTFYV